MGIEISCRLDAITVPGVRDVRFTDVVTGVDGSCQRALIATLDNGKQLHVTLIGKSKDHVLVKVQRPLHI